MDDYKTERYKTQTTPQTTSAPSTPPQTPQIVIAQPQLPPQPDRPVTLSESSLKSVASELYNMFRMERESQLPQGVTPVPGLEEVEVIGEKINYKVALNPDVFWRWNVFKGQNARLAGMGQAEMFMGDFSDFIDLATKTLLSTFGMYPTVMTFTGGKMLVEMPVREED